MPGADATVQVWVNDEPHAVPVGGRLQDLLSVLGLAGRPGLAVAVNGAVVTRAKWGETLLTHADRVLVIRASQGG
jgi:sulfur carrier protein